MPSESSTVPIDLNHIPHEHRLIVLGPFSHATGSAALVLGAGANVPIGPIFDRQETIASISATAETWAGATRTIRIAYATNNQTMADAVTASQFITTAFELFDPFGPGQVGALTIDTTKNVVPSGARLFAVLGATSDTALAGLRIVIRTRTLVR